MMTRPFYIVIVTSLAVAFALAGCFRDTNPDQDKPTVRVDSPSPPENDEPTNPGDEDSGSADNDNTFAKPQLTESDLARTSWENPFRSRLWSCEGWCIDKNLMTCESDSGQAATFLKAYRNVVIECRFSHAQKNQSASQENVPIECELRLLNQNSNRRACLSLMPGSITLTESVDDANMTVQILREADRTTGDDLSDVVVSLTLTPNRLLVAVDGQMKINVTRPGSIMMADCLAQFVVSKPDIVLSDIRFEGD